MLRALLGRLQLLFWCAGVLLCGLAISTYLRTRHFQATENRRLEEALRARIPNPPHAVPIPTAPEKAVPPRKTGSLVGRIEIPRLNLSAIVLEGSDTRTLSLGVGRVPETSEPGQAGNVVLGGHRDTFFRPLSGIRSGDSIKLVTPDGSYSYKVDWTKVVDPEDTAVLNATPEPALTLVTCYPFHYIGPAPRRFIVRAHEETPNDPQHSLNPASQVVKTAAATDHARQPGPRRLQQPTRKSSAQKIGLRRRGHAKRGNIARRPGRAHDRVRATQAGTKHRSAG